MSEPTLIFDRSQAGRRGTQVRAKSDCAHGKRRLPETLARAAALPLPEVSELELTRHYVALSHITFGVDRGFYPLGSCTMKYNPKATEAVAGRTGFAHVHPSQPAATTQGLLRIMYDLQQWLAEMTGMDSISLQPAAGAQGEFAGMLIFRRFFEQRGDTARNIMIVPDSAHGTNPASAVLAGFTTSEVDCVNHGGIMSVDLLEQAIARHGADHIAGIMLTNPSTLGVFEENILSVAARLHEIGAQLYYDGANLNALVGITRPGDMGFDLVHINTHKTFSTPHGGGGPGAGPIGVKSHLADLLPSPLVVKSGDGYCFYDPPQSIGRVKLHHGQFLVLLRAWAYILLHGPQGLKRIAEYSILNANYLQARLQGAYEIPFGHKHCMHEFVASADRQAKLGVRGLDIAKALLNDGYHAPTVYFPLIVHEALMIEPTETESPETLDLFVESMLRYAQLAQTDPESLKALPNLRVKHLDETAAARNINVRWQPATQAAEGAGTP
jgi:glycine dehydrogenase subunit 2